MPSGNLDVSLETLQSAECGRVIEMRYASRGAERDREKDKDRYT